MQDSIANSLIGFLAKKSLFTNSPTKASTKKRSKSKDSKDNLNYSYRDKPSLQVDLKSQSNQLNLFRENSQKRLRKPYQQLSEPVYSPKVSPIRYQPIQRTFNKKQNSYFQNSQTANKEIRGSQNSFFKTNKSNNNIWAGLVTQSTSNFQSARMQSANCLQQLSVKLHSQISNINYKIEVFNSKMSKVINIQFKNLKEKINKIVEQVFKESQRQMRQYMKVQQKLLAGELVEMKQLLQNQYLKVESMKQQIASNTWRKVAGELISSELEQKVQEYLRVSKNIDAQYWEIGQLGGNKLYQLENHLRDMIKLNR